MLCFYFIKNLLRLFARNFRKVKLLGNGIPDAAEIWLHQIELLAKPRVKTLGKGVELSDTVIDIRLGEFGKNTDALLKYGRIELVRREVNADVLMGTDLFAKQRNKLAVRRQTKAKVVLVECDLPLLPNHPRNARMYADLRESGSVKELLDLCGRRISALYNRHTLHHSIDAILGSAQELDVLQVAERIGVCKDSQKLAIELERIGTFAVVKLYDYRSVRVISSTVRVGQLLAPSDGEYDRSLNPALISLDQ